MPPLLSFKTEIQDIVHTLKDKWFDHFGVPQEIHFKKGKVEVSQLALALEQLTGSTPNDTPICRSRNKTFNTETKTQWRINQKEMPDEEFVNAINFFHHTRGAGPNIGTITTQPPQPISQDTESNKDVSDNVEISQHYPYRIPNRWKQKNIRICCHKLS